MRVIRQFEGHAASHALVSIVLHYRHEVGYFQIFVDSEQSVHLKSLQILHKYPLRTGLCMSTIHFAILTSEKDLSLQSLMLIVYLSAQDRKLRNAGIRRRCDVLQ